MQPRFPRTDYCKAHNHVHSGGKEPHCYSCEREYRMREEQKRREASNQADEKALQDYIAALASIPLH